VLAGLSLKELVAWDDDADAQGVAAATTPAACCELAVSANGGEFRAGGGAVCGAGPPVHRGQLSELLHPRISS